MQRRTFLGSLTGLRRFVPYEAIPAHYGLGWHDPMSLETVCFPVPLNVLSRLAYKAWGCIRFPWRKWTGIELKIAEMAQAERSKLSDYYAKEFELRVKVEVDARMDAVEQRVAELCKAEHAQALLRGEKNVC